MFIQQSANLISFIQRCWSDAPWFCMPLTSWSFGFKNTIGGQILQHLIEKKKHILKLMLKINIVQNIAQNILMGKHNFVQVVKNYVWQVYYVSDDKTNFLVKQLNQNRVQMLLICMSEILTERYWNPLWKIQWSQI